MLLRILSAIIGVAVILGVGAFWGNPGLVGLCCLVTAFVVYEYSFLVEQGHWLLQLLFVGLAYLFFLFFVFVSQSFLSFLFCFIVLSSIFVVIANQTVAMRMAKLSQWLMGIIYSGALTGLVTYGTLRFGTLYFALLLAISFSTDTFAYIGGKLYGRTKLVPGISPNKTIEGSITGLAGGVIGGLIAQAYFGDLKNWLTLGLLFAAASVFSQIGDLFESLLKRYSGVKDSGSILPGHGGILDRIDGLLFAGPILYLGMIGL